MPAQDNVLIFDVQDLRTLKMADFGMAYFLRECSVSYEDGMGTPEYDHPLMLSFNVVRPYRRVVTQFSDFRKRRYSAPEVQSIPSPGHGKPSDMWSFGATLHVLLTGRNAFGSRCVLSPSCCALRIRRIAFGQEGLGCRPEGANGRPPQHP